jgi:hypothetical protein
MSMSRMTVEWDLQPFSAHWSHRKFIGIPLLNQAINSFEWTALLSHSIVINISINKEEMLRTVLVFCGLVKFSPIEESTRIFHY